MKLIYNKIFLKHDTGAHPESRRRLESLGELPETKIESGEHYLSLVHNEQHIETVKRACRQGLPLDGDTLTSSGSYDAAVHAAGAAILAAEQKAFALLRPPGHHAYSSRASGFCLFNNVAIAAQKLVNEGKRVAIIDIDGHYGDGTADIFYNSDQVLYCSLHQYPAFPGKGFILETGTGKGEGFTVNLPLPPGSGDDLFLNAIETVFVPITEQFKPDVVAISAGFDAHQLDPLLDLKVSLQGFYQAGRIFSSKFSHLFAVLEGGYNTEVFPKCVQSFVDGVNHVPPLFTEEATVSGERAAEEYAEWREKLSALLSPKWKFS